MSFQLPKLSYSYEDLEPNIDGKTMEIHYNKHHATYTNNLNNLIQETDMRNLSIEEILRRSHIESPGIRNNSGGFYNHNFFWKILIPTKKFSNPSQSLYNVINKNFGNFHNFKKKFTDTSMNRFGSGWVWLCVKNNQLVIGSTANQDNPIMYGVECEGIPILGLDVWEHAYYLKYQNRRIDYISSFWNIVDWKMVEENYNHATIKKQ
ncbi:superoxide dismutase [Blattabacterium cuenoti]|uniref:superoxide dismutase n=1 Tax=Blattabacterium cuenoti TaxID=1653831 RepID=UPI00163C9D43|nr:superoxide dismutase [Blattabacterium cuenoti]